MTEKDYAQTTDSEFGRRLLLDPKERLFVLSKEMDAIQAVKTHSDINVERFIESGVSVIIPTYDGANRIHAALDSLVRQTLDPRRFEIICVVNGVDNGTTAEVQKYQKRFPAINIRVFSKITPSAGGARNLGLDLARYSRITFVDDDDTVEPDFLASALSVSSGTNVVVSSIIDVAPGGIENESNTLNQRIMGLRGRDVKITQVPWVLGFNACKLFPRDYARRASYETDLASGEDLVYFAHLLQYPELKVAVAPEVVGAAYKRHLRNDSVSRRATTYDFGVLERLACMEKLDRIPIKPQTQAYEALGQLKRAQAAFIGRYLKENPRDQTRVFQQIEDSIVTSFPWDMVHNEPAQDLAFVYCFAPFSDTSAVVAAKALAERRVLVDVITNDMSKVRRYDPEVSALADRWIADRTLIKSSPSFAGWDPICDYASKALEVAERKNSLNGGYRTVYSRALWVGSHVAAAAFKTRHWAVKWSAEFSDPLRRDAEGKPRVGDLTDNALTNQLMDAIAARGFGHLSIETLFDLVEIVTMVTADELIFTNQNQLDYMVGLYQDSQLEALVRSKSVVRHHPVPPDHAYNHVATTYTVPNDCVNIAYFGSFYRNRGIGDVLLALANLSIDSRRQLRLHIFSNKPEEVAEQVRALGVSPMVYNNRYMSYMEFLSATRLFDYLLVNDVVRGTGLPINPFLPSKYSDYLGSGKRIVALVDEGSPLAQMDLPHSIPAGNVSAIREFLEKAIMANLMIS